MLDAGNTSSVIPMEEDAKTIGKALSVVRGKEALSYDLPFCNKLLRFADKYDFLHIRGNIYRSARKKLDLGGTNAWEVLQIAIKLDDFLVKDSITLLSSRHPPTKWEYSKVQLLGLRYY